LGVTLGQVSIPSVDTVSPAGAIFDSSYYDCEISTLT